jgi:hypothetical protein
MISPGSRWGSLPRPPGEGIKLVSLYYTYNNTDMAQLTLREPSLNLKSTLRRLIGPTRQPAENVINDQVEGVEAAGPGGSVLIDAAGIMKITSADK